VNLTVSLVNTFVVVAVGAILTLLTNDRFRVLRREMTELKSDIARVESRLDAGIAAVRSDLVQVALAVGARRDAAGG